MLNNEQFASTQKANLQTLFDLSGKAMEGIESLVNLNLQTTKAAFGEAQSTAMAALSVKDPQSLIALQAGALQPSAEKATAYFREVYDIANTMKAEITKVIGNAASGTQGSFADIFEAASQNAPAGSENGIALWKSAVATASNAFEGMQKAAQQATDMAEANYTAVTNQAVKSTGKARRA